jgi:stage V sporulation protein SpoVS
MKLMTRARGGLIVLSLILWLPSFARIGPTPDWVLRVAASTTPNNVGGAPAVVLFDETTREVDALGISSITHRVAIRLLGPQGKDLLRTQVGYLKDSHRVRTTDAWLIRAGKEVKPPQFTEWVDRSSDPYGTLYSDFRLKSMSRSDDAVTGDVFVAETRVTGPMLTAQDIYTWGWDGLPVAEEIYRLKLPTGFSIKYSVHGDKAPSVVESSDKRDVAWTITNQPFTLAESNAPLHETSAPLLLVNIEPPAGASKFSPVVLHSWTDVSSWLNTLNAAQCDTSPQLAEKTRELTANCKTTLEKIRVLGAFVQTVRYLAFDSGLAKGFGYQPRKASHVFGNRYGDCKDKANLLCAMLREVGVESFIAAARSGDDGAIWPDFAAANQFDHAIAAIRVDESCELPSVVNSTKWGRLLFFDPTAQHTALGDLPWYLQGTSVFVQAVGSESLIELPRVDPERGHLYVRKAVLQVDRNGSLTGEASVLGRGQAGAELRQSLFVASTDEALTKFAVELLGDSSRSARLEKLSRDDDASSGMCGVRFTVSRTDYLQFLKNSLVVAKPDIFSRGAIPALTAPTRHRPVKLRPIAFEDEVELVLPDGLQPEELPASAILSSPYGDYRREFTVVGHSIKMVRRLQLKQQMVPVAQYEALRKFLSDLGKADRASVLLRAGT